jgi:hypothetical protein
MKSSENIEGLLRSVDGLCSYQFFIPHYQRGYRWTEKQVTALLEDINNFQPQDDKAFYCLQPLVIKSRSVHENQWEIIDGQQRLTTIYLILTFFEEEKVFGITYEKWNNSAEFLKNIASKNDNDAKTYIDYFLMYAAYAEIKRFFEEKSRNDFLIKLKEKVKFIWHDVSEQISSEDSNVSAESIFLNFNIGKIALTDLELTKALFLRKYDDAKDNMDWKIAQQKIADEWGKFDRLFNDEDFLAFLSIDDTRYKKYNKLEFLFDLKSVELIESPDSHRIFHDFEGKLNDFENLEKHWKSVKSIFVVLHEWYINPKLNKFVGYYFYLLWKDGSSLNKKIENIKSLIDCYEKIKSKDDFEREIKKLIKDNLSDLFKNVFEKDAEKDKSAYFSNLRYSDSQSNGLIKKLLVLLDVLSFHDDESYPFKKLDRVDIEHIHALGLGEDDKKSIGQGVTDEIRNAIREFLSEFHDDKFNEVLNKDNITIDDLKKLSGEINDELGLNGMDNLTLLPASINRSIKNSRFSDKRKVVVAKLKGNTYIHRSSQRVFMKFYSNESDLNTWNINARQDYLNGLKETLSYYIEGFYTLDASKEQQANEQK